MNARGLILMLLAAALLGACGGSTSSAGEFEGERRDVAEVVENLQDAAEAGEADRICSEIMAREAVERLGDCKEEVTKAIEDADAFELEVQSVIVSGETATARVKGQEGTRDVVRTFEFVREDGRWKATGLT